MRGQHQIKQNLAGLATDMVLIQLQKLTHELKIVQDHIKSQIVHTTKIYFNKVEWFSVTKKQFSEL